jgi:pimeloyl-ACP methyl ester carboxylesterase
MKIELNMLVTLFISLILLVGCGGDSKPGLPAPIPAPAPEPQPEPEPVGFIPGTHPRFDPIVGDIPFHSDLVFASAATSDGTADVGVATDPVRMAVNQLDGFSSSAYFDILIEGSIDPASVKAGETVFLVEVDTQGKDALDPANIAGLAGVADFEVTAISLDGEIHNAIRIVPSEPLKPKTKYLVFLTNAINDAAGQALTPSLAYHNLRTEAAGIPDALQPVQEILAGWEQLASNFLIAASHGQLTPDAAVEKLVLAYTFTTSDATATLLAMAAPRAAVMQILRDATTEPVFGFPEVIEWANAGILSPPAPRPLAISQLSGVDFNNFSGALLANVGTLYTGYIRLPYYLTPPDGLPFAGFLSKQWIPNLELAALLNIEIPTDVDGSYNLTYRFPFAAKVAEESLPLQLTLPQDDHAPTGAATCSQLHQTNGYPVVIFVHGITNDRTSVLGLAHTLASRCIATVAIDLPLHGVPANSAFVNVLNVEHSEAIPFSTLYAENTPRERHFNVAGATGMPAPMDFTQPGPNDGSGAQFINLGHLANTRDNNRQAVMDLLNLNASLANINTEVRKFNAIGLDVDQLNVVGLSLGSMLSSVFVTVNQSAIHANARAGLSSNLKPIRGLVTSTPGAQVSQVLVNSPTFAPVINSGLANAGVPPGSTDYQRFVYAAQSMLDAADPVSFLPTLAQLGVPVLVQQVNGDLVIPNAVEGAPLAGTEGFAQLLLATQVGVGETQLGRGIVKVTAGEHASLLLPNTLAPQITTEFQTQVVTFVLNNGRVTVGAGAPQSIETPEQ